jgi:predicted 3-demethylubiquinone-9 3-methyltransferase (glyoxalase superfamily)
MAKLAMQKIHPVLWFDREAEDAMLFYTSIFKNSKVGQVTRYGDSEPRIEGWGKPGDVLTASFEIEGLEFTGLNGGPLFKFSEAISLMIACDDQKELDYYWDKLVEGGKPQQCGWLKDKFGVVWQVTPKRLMEMMSDPDPVKVKRAFEAMLPMVKLDIATLERAFKG